MLSTGRALMRDRTRVEMVAVHVRRLKILVVCQELGHGGVRHGVVGVWREREQGRWVDGREGEARMRSLRGVHGGTPTASSLPTSRRVVRHDETVWLRNCDEAGANVGRPVRRQLARRSAAESVASRRPLLRTSRGGDLTRLSHAESCTPPAVLPQGVHSRKAHNKDEVRRQALVSRGGNEY
jgi:hypothetical protein